jgi:hypothetical protein
MVSLLEKFLCLNNTLNLPQVKQPFPGIPASLILITKYITAQTFPAVAHGIPKTTLKLTNNSY